MIDMGKPMIPPVSMLWESVDPTEALTQRFGFASAVAAVEWLSDAVTKHWDLHIGGCERLVISSGNVVAWITVGEQRMIAKWSMYTPVFPRLSEVAKLTRWLDERGIPVSAPQPALDGRLQLEIGRFSLGLQNVIAGELLDVADPEQVRAAGEALAVMHRELAAYPGTIPAAQTPQPGTQLVGNDFRSANILWADGRISAVLDLEEAGYAPRADDVAKATALLGTRYHHWKPTSPDVRDAFITAYQAVHPLPDQELADVRTKVATYIADWPH